MKDYKKLQIISNQIRCDYCGDTPWSGHRHDYRNCKCGRVSVDGGNDYLRRGWIKGATYTDMSIEFDSGHLKCLVADVNEHQKTRNALGVTYAMFRWFRDNGYEIRRLDDE
jgi:hypothetical protein